MLKLTSGLGPNQIAWLRANVPSFKEAHDAVKASDERAAKIRAKLEKRVAESTGVGA